MPRAIDEPALTGAPEARPKRSVEAGAPVKSRPGPLPAGPDGPFGPQDLLAIQRLAGNGAVSAMLGATPVRPPPPEAASAPTGATVIEHHGRVTTVSRGNRPHVTSPRALGGKSEPAAVQRDWDIDLPDIELPSLPSLSSILEHIPGYPLLTLVLGYDVGTGETVAPTPANVIPAVMGLVPGGEFVYRRLSDLEILQDGFALVEGALSTHDLTTDRLERETTEAWEAFDATPRLGIIDDAIAAISRPIESIGADVEVCAHALVDGILDVIKRAAIDQAEGFLAESDEARQVWDLARAVLRYDPLRDERVEASTEEIIERFLLLIGKEAELEEMRERNTLADTASWLEPHLESFVGIVADFTQLVAGVVDALSITELANLPENLVKLARDSWNLITGIAAFAGAVATEVLEAIKRSLLGLLDEQAHQVPGFHLITVILGQNPLTEAPVPPTAENLIRGFITLLPGGDAKYEELAESGVIAQAAQRIESAVERLGISWDFIVSLFSDLWNSFTIDDLAAPDEAFNRILAEFGEPIDRLFGFVGVVVGEVVTLVLELMDAPTELLGNIVNNALASIERIQEDPGAFFEHLLGALELGLTSFIDNILTHLADGLASWLFRGLEDAGVQIPDEFTLESIFGLILDVLGISEENLWSKLAERIGDENVQRLRGAIDQLSGVWSFVADVQDRGVSAIWDFLAEQLSGLWDSVLDTAKEWVVTEVIEAAGTRLVSMLDPTGIMAVVNSLAAFFNAIQSAIEYLRDMLEIVDRYVATIAEIASGNVEPAAEQLEGGLAASLPVAIGFLANQVGLGNVAEEVKEMIEAVRAVVDEALDWLFDRAVEAGSAVLESLGGQEQDDAAEGQSAAGEAENASDQAALEATPGSLSHPVIVGGQRHTLSIDTATGAVSMASAVPQSLFEHLRRWEADSDDRETILEAAERAHDDVQAAGQGHQDEVARARLSQLADILCRLTVRVHGLEDVAAPPAGLGRIAPHAQNSSHGTSTEPTERVLWSEHVIPKDAISAYLEALGLPRLSDTEYERQHTILIYRTAARIKDYGATGAEEGRDNVLRHQIRPLLRRGTTTPIATSRSRYSRRRGRGLSADEKREVDERSASLAHRRRQRMVDSDVASAVLAARVTNCVRAVSSDHDVAKAQLRGHPDPSPTEDQIRSAAARQIRDIVDIILARP